MYYSLEKRINEKTTELQNQKNALEYLLVVNERDMYIFRSLNELSQKVDIQYQNNSLFAYCGVSEKIDFPSKVRELKNSLRRLVAEYKIPKTFKKM